MSAISLDLKHDPIFDIYGTFQRILKNEQVHFNFQIPRLQIYHYLFKISTPLAAILSLTELIQHSAGEFLFVSAVQV
jgi:hypothetical protein